MKYTAYVLIEPGMDRPCFSHTPPSAEQKKRLRSKGGRSYSFDLDIPGFELIEQQLVVTSLTDL